MKVKKENIETGDKRADKLIVISDLDDLVFEHRNRDYGAYQLRKKYNRVLLFGTLLASILICLAVIIPFLSRPNTDKVVSGGSGYVQVHMDNMEPPEEIYVPPSPPPPEPARIQEVVKYVPPVVVDSVPPIEKAPISTDEVLASTDGEMLDTGGSGFGDELINGQGSGTIDEAFFQVEVMPTFKGGDLTKFRDWVGKHTNYPQAAIDNKIRGKVYLTFIVEKDGSVTNVTVVKGVDPILDAEAVKTISESPKWSPGLQRGLPVRVRFLIPMSFNY